MRECGEIIEIKGDIAYVRMTRGKECDGCNLCSAFGDKSTVLEADNAVGARSGDRVIVEIRPGIVVGHSLLIFIMPVLLLMVGYLLGHSLPWPRVMSGEGSGVVTAILFFLLSFPLIKLFDLRFSRSGHRAATIIGHAEN